jgi:hypothetical protein
VVGLINMPTARVFNSSVHGMTLYVGDPVQKVTITSNPFDWLEASFFYTALKNRPYCSRLSDPMCQQEYKDKGFNFKLRIKEEDSLPAIAVGFNDIAGTGLFGSEYIVSSYGVKNLDFHFGIGWGSLNNISGNYKNPLGYIYDDFNFRPSEVVSTGGQFELSKYFSGRVSPFYGLSYAHGDNLIFKFEKDSTYTEPTNSDSSNFIIDYIEPKSDFNFGFDYKINQNFTIGVFYERGNFLSAKFIYKNNPLKKSNKYEYKKISQKTNNNKYKKLVNNLEENGIGVNKIIEKNNTIGLQLTQFIHPNIQIIEEIIQTAKIESGIDADIKKDIRVANLRAYTEIEEDLYENSKIMYQRNPKRNFSSSTNVKFKPFLASREEFFKGAFLLENDSEYTLKDNLFFNMNLKYSLYDNFDDFIYPPVDTYPAQVRSDIKSYLEKMRNGILIGRAQFDYYHTPKNNHHFMATAGILEDMFSGYGFEYLYFKNNTNYSFGFEVFQVHKRDYEWNFGHLDYKNLTYNANLYVRNFGSIPFDMKVSAGEYLAGDIGSTIEFSRSFSNGVKFGVFATFTDVSAEQFGEGSFDKGIFFNVPIYGNFINYSWRPLTKDPGAKIIRKNSLHDLLIKFQPIN